MKRKQTVELRPFTLGSILRIVLGTIHRAFFAVLIAFIAVVHISRLFGWEEKKDQHEGQGTLESEKYYHSMNLLLTPVRWIEDTVKFILGCLAAVIILPGYWIYTSYPIVFWGLIVAAGVALLLYFILDEYQLERGMPRGKMCFLFQEPGAGAHWCGGLIIVILAGCCYGFTLTEVGQEIFYDKDPRTVKVEPETAIEHQCAVEFDKSQIDKSPAQFAKADKACGESMLEWSRKQEPFWKPAHYKFLSQ